MGQFTENLHKLIAEQFADEVDPSAIHVEIIEWHEALHAGDNGLDKVISSITLPGVLKLRQLVNENFLDVLYYMSSVYHQKIIDVVINEMNEKYERFIDANRGFHGSVRWVILEG